MTAIDDAAETLARALRPPHPPHAYGWGPLVEPCRAALIELVAAGWTPPAGQAGTENERLRAEIAGLTARLDDLNRHLDRLTTEEMAFSAFRGLLVQLAHPCGRNPLRLDAGRSYSAAEIQAWLVRLLATADKRADAARRQRARQLAQQATRADRAQMALFEAAPAPVGVERVPVAAARAAGL